MGQERLEQAISRIERAIERIESAAAAHPPPRSGDGEDRLRTAYESLRSRVQHAVVRLDALMEMEGRADGLG
jgi:hypothetical protein